MSTLPPSTFRTNTQVLADLQGYFFSIWNLVAVFLVSMATHLTMIVAASSNIRGLLLQIVSLVFYLPVLSAFFDEPPHWSALSPFHRSTCILLNVHCS